MLDVTSHLVGMGPEDACRAGHVRQNVTLRPGGTGLVAAVEARRTGFEEVALWGSIGLASSGRPDAGGDAAVLALREAGVRDLLRRDVQAPTGSVVQVCFAGGRRLMVADPGANALVDDGGPADEVTRFAARADVVFVSGYVMTAPARAAQVRQVVALARSHRAVVVLDVVPHRVEQLAPAIVELLDDVDVVVGESGTLHHIFGSGDLPATDREIEELACRILRAHRLAVVRPSDERELIAASGNCFTWVDTGYGRLSPEQRPASHDRRNLTILADWLTAPERSR